MTCSTYQKIWHNGKKKMKKIEPVLERIRPKEPLWDFSELEAVIRLWAKNK